MGSLQIVGSIFIQISKFLWVQTRTLRFHCHSSVQRQWGDIQTLNVCYGWIFSWNNLVIMLHTEWSSETDNHICGKFREVQGRRDSPKKKTLKYCHNSPSQYKPHKGIHQLSCTISCTGRLGFEQQWILFFLRFTCFRPQDVSWTYSSLRFDRFSFFVSSLVLFH